MWVKEELGVRVMSKGANDPRIADRRFQRVLRKAVKRKDYVLASKRGLRPRLASGGLLGVQDKVVTRRKGMSTIGVNACSRIAVAGKARKVGEGSLIMGQCAQGGRANVRANR